MQRCIVLDIEGTTTPISFVTDVLFPYARDNVGKHLILTYETAETQDDIKLLRSQVRLFFYVAICRISILFTLFTCAALVLIKPENSLCATGVERLFGSCFLNFLYINKNMFRLKKTWKKELLELCLFLLIMLGKRKSLQHWFLMLKQ